MTYRIQPTNRSCVTTFHGKLQAGPWLGVAAVLIATAAHGQEAPANTATAVALPPVTTVPAPEGLPEMSPEEGLAAPFRVRVTAPFIELHTSPGRGFPVTFVAGRDEWVTVLLRHTDWFKVRTSGGQLGWVSREQMASTLMESGEAMNFRDPNFDDYLRRRVDVGAGYGASKTRSMIRAWVGVRVSDTLSVEYSTARVQATLSDTNLWHINVLAEPWSDQRLSPFMGVGMGKYHYVPAKSVVNPVVYDSKLAVATLGARYHLAGRVALRVDYSLYTAFITDSRTRGYQALTAGLSLFY